MWEQELGNQAEMSKFPNPSVVDPGSMSRLALGRCADRPSVRTVRDPESGWINFSSAQNFRRDPTQLLTPKSETNRETKGETKREGKSETQGTTPIVVTLLDTYQTGLAFGCP